MKKKIYKRRIGNIKYKNVFCQYSSKNNMILHTCTSFSYLQNFVIICSYFSSFKSTFSQLDFKKLMQFSSILKILLTNYKLYVVS